MSAFNFISNLSKSSGLKMWHTFAIDTKLYVGYHFYYCNQIQTVQYRSPEAMHALRNAFTCQYLPQHFDSCNITVYRLA